MSCAVAGVTGTWQVDLRRGCHPRVQVVEEVLPVVLRLEDHQVTLLHEPFPRWLTRDRTLPRRVRSGVRSFSRISSTGSTIVVRASTETIASATPDLR